MFDILLWKIINNDHKNPPSQVLSRHDRRLTPSGFAFVWRR